MTKIVPLELGQAGLAHMKNWYKGWDKLAGYAYGHLEKFHHCLAFVPEGTSLAEAMDYDTGRNWRGGPAATANYLMAVHRQHPKYCLVVMDYCIHSDDPHLAEDNRTFYYENQVYAYLNGRDFAEEALIDTLHTAAHHSMGFVIEATIDEAVAEKQFISKAVFETLAANIRMISLSAYDGESYLLAD